MQQSALSELSEFLQSVPLFRDAAPGTLSEVLRTHGATIESAEAGETILRGDGAALIVIRSGRVRIRSTDDERNLVLRTAGPGEVIGAAALFLRQTPPFSHVEAMTRAEAVLLGFDTVHALLRADERFMDAYLAFLADRVRFLNQKIRCFTAGSAERRLALWLAGENEQTPVSLTALSDMLDIGRASLYRALDKLEAEGFIRRAGREITVVSQDAILQKYLS